MSTKKRLISNFLSLSSVQVANYILPLITVPYLVRVLGPEKFGLIAFSQALIAYFSLLTDYGFNLSATREISIHRENSKKLSEIYFSVMFIKFLLMVLSLMLLCILVFSINKFREEWLLYLLTFGMVLGNVIFPAWFLRGIERMREIAILNILTRIIFTVAVFIFIRSKTDYILLPIINSVGFIVAGLLGLWIIFSRIGIRVKMPLIADIKYQLKDGWHVFISTIAISLYTTSNTVILGLFTNNTIVGYYSAGEKIVKAVQGLIAPLSQTIYPHISKLASESKEAALAFVRKVVRLVGGAMLGVSFLLLLFAQQISNLVLGSKFQESIPVIQILSFLPFIIGLSNIFGIQVMLNFGLKQVFTRILIIASFVNILLALILVLPFQHIGISFSVLITELFVTITMFLVLHRNGLNVIQFVTSPEAVK